MAARDPFEVLDLRPDATLEDVHAAYIRLAKIVHPDRFALDPQPLRDEAARRMTELNLAYEQAMASFEYAAPATSAPTVCIRCEPPSPNPASFQCARCRTWWDRTTCVRCGRGGYTAGGAGALYTCRDCSLAASPATCPRCGSVAHEGAPSVGAVPTFACSECGSAWHERECGYCGAPALLGASGDAFICSSCRYTNLAMRPG